MVALPERQRGMSGESARGLKGKEVSQYMDMPQMGMLSLMSTLLPCNGGIVCDEASTTEKEFWGEIWHQRVQLAYKGFPAEQASKRVYKFPLAIAGGDIMWWRFWRVFSLLWCDNLFGICKVKKICRVTQRLLVWATQRPEFIALTCGRGIQNVNHKWYGTLDIYSRHHHEVLSSHPHHQPIKSPEQKMPIMQWTHQGCTGHVC